MSRATAEGTIRPTRRRRIVATVCLGLIAILIAGISWHATSLRGIPDIGEPFDVASFSAMEVRDENNAYILYRQAAANYRATTGLKGALKLDWAKASDIERRWLDENRPALEIWKRGTDRPDAALIAPAEMTLDTDLSLIHKLREFARLAQLEGSRLEALGDYLAAWRWYRAVLRSSRHCGRRGNLWERLEGVNLNIAAVQRITSWAQNPCVDAIALRGALAEIQASVSMTPVTSDVVKCEYIAIIHTMEQPVQLRKLLDENEDPNVGEWRETARAWRDFQAFYKREPERSRRLFRLVVANWLAYCDLQQSRRPTFHAKGNFFSLSPDPRHLAPDALWDCVESSVVLKALLPAVGAVFLQIDRERARQAQLIVDVASELYLRERGKHPDSPQDLVGTYLDKLPEGLP
jgi:hypothetical protein